MPGCRRAAAALGRNRIGVCEDIDRTPPRSVASIQVGTPVSRHAIGRMPPRIERPSDTGEKGPPGKPVNRIGWSGEIASLGAIARTAVHNTDAATAIAMWRVHCAGHVALPVMLSAVSAVVMCTVFA